MAANMLPSQPLGLESALTVGVIVLISMRAQPDKRLSLHFEKYFSVLQLVLTVCAFCLVLTDPLFSFA